MKHILTIFICLLSLGLFAQNATPKAASSSNCYKDWFTLFKDRGTRPVADGANEVIISLRTGDYYSECFMGRIEVGSGRMIGKLQVQKVDGTYEDWDKSLNPTYLNSEGRLKDELRDIYNGMSAVVTLADGESVRLFFYQTLIEKTKANKKAPAPSALIKN